MAKMLLVSFFIFNVAAFAARASALQQAFPELPNRQHWKKQEWQYFFAKTPKVLPAQLGSSLADPSTSTFMLSLNAEPCPFLQAAPAGATYPAISALFVPLSFKGHRFWTVPCFVAGGTRVDALDVGYSTLFAEVIFPTLRRCPEVPIFFATSPENDATLNMHHWVDQGLWFIKLYLAVAASHRATLTQDDLSCLFDSALSYVSSLIDFVQPLYSISRPFDRVSHNPYAAQTLEANLGDIIIACVINNFEPGISQLIESERLPQLMHLLTDLRKRLSNNIAEYLDARAVAIPDGVPKQAKFALRQRDILDPTWQTAVPYDHIPIPAPIQRLRSNHLMHAALSIVLDETDPFRRVPALNLVDVAAAIQHIISHGHIVLSGTPIPRNKTAFVIRTACDPTTVMIQLLASIADQPIFGQLVAAQFQSWGSTLITSTLPDAELLSSIGIERITTRGGNPAQYLVLCCTNHELGTNKKNSFSTRRLVTAWPADTAPGIPAFSEEVTALLAADTERQVQNSDAD
jgi:hypothetical protein